MAKAIESVESSIDENESDESVEIDKEFSYDCEDSLDKSNILVEIKRDSFPKPFNNMEDYSLTKDINLETEIYKHIESSIDENESEESVQIDNEFSHLTQNQSFNHSRDSSQESYMHNDEYHEDSLAKAIKLQSDIYKQIETMETSIDENESDEDDNHLEDSLDNTNILIQPEVCIKRDQFSGQAEIYENEFEEIDIHNDNHFDDSLDKTNIPLIQIKRDSFSRTLSQMEEDSLTKAINSQTDIYKRIETIENESLEIEKEFSHLTQNQSFNHSRDSSQESDKHIDEDSVAKATNLETDIYKRIESLESSLDENRPDKHNDDHFTEQALIHIKRDSFSRQIEEDSLAKAINLQTEIYKHIESSLDENELEETDKHIDDIELSHHFEDSLLNAIIYQIYKKMESTLDKNESADNKHNVDECEEDILDNSNILIKPLVCTKCDSFSQLSTEMEEDSLSKDISLQTVIYKQMESSIDENESDQDDNRFEEDSLEKSKINFLLPIKRDSFSKTLTQIGEDSLAKAANSQSKRIESMESLIDENECNQDDNHNEDHYEDSLDKSNILIEPLVYIKRDSFSSPIGEESLANLPADIHKQIEIIKSSSDQIKLQDEINYPIDSMESPIIENESDKIAKLNDVNFEDSLSKSNILVRIKRDSFSKDSISTAIKTVESPIDETEPDEIDIQIDDSQDTLEKSNNQVQEDSFSKSINLKADIYNPIESMESSLDKNESNQDDNLFEDSLDKTNILKQPIVCESVESSLDENESEEIDKPNDDIEYSNDCKDSNILKQPRVLIKRDSFSEQMEEDSLSKTQAEIYNPINGMESSIDENESKENKHFEDSIDKSNILQIKCNSFSKTLTQIEEDSLSKTINLQIDIYKQIENLESSLDENESEEIDKQNDDIELPHHHFEDFLDNSNILEQTKRGSNPLSKAIHEKIETMESSLDENDSDESVEIVKEFSHLDKNKSNDKNHEDSLSKAIDLKADIYYTQIETMESSLESVEKEKKFSHLFQDSLGKSNILKQPSDQIKRDSFSKPFEEDSLGKSTIYKQLETKKSSIDDNEFSHHCQDSLGKQTLIQIKKDSFSRPLTFTKMREDSLAKTINLQVKKEGVKYFFI